MSKTNTDGPAFPVAGKSGAPIDYGMALRDYFAAKAMQGLLAGYIEGVPPEDITAQASYSYADAMLKAREQ